jgi:hypothetical protein
MAEAMMAGMLRRGDATVSERARARGGQGFNAGPQLTPCVVRQAKNVLACNRGADRLRYLEETYGVSTTTDSVK